MNMKLTVKNAASCYFQNILRHIVSVFHHFLKNKPELVEKAKAVYAELREKYGNVTWDDSGNIGKRYHKQDEIGTPKCVVIDFDTLEDDTVTVRDRDTMAQTRVKVTEL